MRVVLRAGGPVIAAFAAVTAVAAADSPCWTGSAGAGDAFEPAALEQIERARSRIASNPGDPSAAGRLGMILHAYESFEAAESCYAEAVEAAPDEPRWRYLHAKVLAWLGDHDAALAETRAALNRQPDFLPARLEEAALLRRAGRFEEALEASEQALEREPEAPQAHYARGRALAALGRTQEAVAALEQARAKAPDYAQARYALAQAYRRTGRMEAARRELEIHRRLGQVPPPEPPNPYLEQVFAMYRGARSHLARGSLAAQGGDAETAVREFEAALEMNPRLPVAHSNLTVLYGALGQFDKAEAHYREAIRISPTWAEAHANWGGLLLEQGRFEQAAATLELAVEANPQFTEARVQLGLALDELGRSAEAAEQYRQALDSDPLHPHARYLFGRSLLEAGRLDEGLDLLEQAVAVGDGRTAAYLDALVRVHEAEGNFEVALGYATRGLERARADGLTEMIAPLEAAIERLAAKAAVQ